MNRFILVVHNMHNHCYEFDYLKYKIFRYLYLLVHTFHLKKNYIYEYVILIYILNS